MFSEWNGERYMLKSGYGDFTFYFNVKFEGYPQGHIQLVIDKWNDKIGFTIRENGIIDGKQIHGKMIIKDGIQTRDGRITQKCGQIQVAVQLRQMKR